MCAKGINYVSVSKNKNQRTINKVIGESYVVIIIK